MTRRSSSGSSVRHPARVTPDSQSPIVTQGLTVSATDGGLDSSTVAAVEQLTIDPSAVLVEATEAETW